MFAVLNRIDPPAHMDRWYLCAVTRTLLDPVAVLCAWGSRQTAYQQMRLFPVASQAAAEEQVNKIVARKIRRGYCVVNSSGIAPDMEADVVTEALLPT